MLVLEWCERKILLIGWRSSQANRVNPSKESNEFVENILEDIDTMGIKYDTVTYTLDYFPKLMEMAIC